MFVVIWMDIITKMLFDNQDLKYREFNSKLIPNIDKDKIKNKNTKKESKKERKNYSDDPYLNDAILSFIEFRKSMKKPMTDHAVKLLISKLNGMTDSVHEQIEILNQSIMNGWQGIFPLKEEKRGRKEVVPGWMKKQGDDLDRAERLLKQGDDLDRLARMLGKTAGNDPEVAARAEALKQSLGV